MIRRITVLMFSTVIAVFWLWFAAGQMRALLTPAPPPPSPTAEIGWTGGTNTSHDIEAAFNHARKIEAQQLGIELPPLRLPDQGAWEDLTAAQRALYLINQERTARGLRPFAGLSPSVARVAQAYAEKILVEDVPLSHELGGQDPGQRLAAEPEIKACMRGWAENLAAFWTSADHVPAPIARAVYGWMYEDGDCCGWGHREALLADMFHNGPSQGGAGLVGIGLAQGGPYQGLQSGSIVVMEAIEPCRRWDYSSLIPDAPEPELQARSAAAATGVALPIGTPFPLPTPINPADLLEQILKFLRR